MLMSHARRRWINLAVVLAVVTPASIASAGTIPLGTSGWTASWDATLDPFLAIVVDGQDANSVFIEKNAQFTSPNLTPIDVVFTQTAPGALPNIVIVDEAITNQTGQSWVEFEMSLTGAAAFNPAATAASGGPAPIGFAIGPFTTAVFSAGNQVLTIGGGSIANGSTWFPGVAVPQGGSLYITATPTGGTPFATFTLRERPIVPEPATFGMLALASLTLLRRGRR
jgi:hypothetical protein